MAATEAAIRSAPLLLLLTAIGLLGACRPGDQLGTTKLCQSYQGLPDGWGRDPHAGMLKIAAGSFQLGSQRGYAEERPLRQIKVNSFWIDRTEVSNAQFASFVKATGYITDAERPGDKGGAVLFYIDYIDPNQPVTPGSWWHLVRGADWRHPKGPGSGIEGRGHDPVVNVSHADALAYAHWLGHQLPSEAQWEYAAKAGRNDAESDRTLRDAAGTPQANFWQGAFPLSDQAEDGYAGRAPVGCYPANPYGLQDMVGNVWEWTSDPWQDSHRPETLADQQARLPGRGQAPRYVTRYVIKGGSFLCAADYCARARASSRQPAERDLPSEHLGFRTVTPAD